MVRALEHEMLKRIHAQGLNMEPQIIVITRLIPEALGKQERCLELAELAVRVYA